MTQPLARTLIPCDTSSLPLMQTGVLVIGGGVAGLSVAIEAARGGASVMLVTKGKAGESNTWRAQGGIAATLHGEPASVESHLQDTLAAGDGLCDEAIARLVVAGSTDAVRFLRDCGCAFDLDQAGEPAIGLEAAHSMPRILHCGGDATGAEIARSLMAASALQPSITTIDETFVIDLLTHEDHCIGALVERGGEYNVIAAGAVVLASGGCGRLYRESSNSRIATGDGHAMAIRAGAVLRDLELVQFHPTLFYVAGAPRTLVTEALRGAGAALRNAAGERFMERYDSRMELAPRDIVARAVEAEMRATGESAMFLDATHLSHDEVTRHFPSFARLCERFGLDTTKSWVPVRPGPHYMIGGLETDARCRSSISGLFAVGEAASSGLHGANRLASNSLLEGVVMGRRLGAELATTKVAAAAFPDIREERPGHNRRIVYSDLRNALKTLVQRHLGVERDKSGLDQFLHRLAPWEHLVLSAKLTGRKPWELANMLTVAAAMAQSALLRQESRGVHYRRDFPEHSPSLAGNHVRYAAKGGATLTRDPGTPST